MHTLTAAFTAFASIGITSAASNERVLVSTSFIVTVTAPQRLSSDVPLQAQLSISAPADAVLQNSAAAFAQALYPPSGVSEALANGSTIEAPLGGYQYIPVGAVTTGVTGKDAESSAWLQGSSGCNNAIVSSNNYFASSDADRASFKNAYTIWDLINVATIHNSSIPADNLLTEETLSRSFDLASTLEWNLAYNASDPVRAISGAVLAGQILDSLQSIVDGTAGSPKFNVQFGLYGAFMAFFGLAKMQDVSSDFQGVTGYASSMAFEIFTTSADAKPSSDDIQVRFLYSNGTASASNLKQFAFLGKDNQSWSDFKSGMSKFAITSTEQWCKECGGTSEKCAGISTNEDTNSAPNSPGDGNGISKPVAGVIGALVTLAVILGIQTLIIVFGGVRLVKKTKVTPMEGNSTKAI
ncbi:hypothetical protein K4F52_004915 [Lecanicillium sp. MT-2017a]|nr:hypothetical protein K4F52_004915 [Lecanicillium sp. MT-2017a]